MKNITLTLEDTVYAAVESEARKHQTSVSALVEGYLRSFEPIRVGIAGSSQPEDKQNREDLVRLFREANLVLGYQPSREKTYER